MGIWGDLATFLQDVNDYAPECQPPFQELTVYAPLGRSVEVTKVSCWVPQEPQRLAFSYSIVGGEGRGGHQDVGEGAGRGQQWFPSSATLLSGNSQSRFSLRGPILVHDNIMLGPPWPEQPRTYELLIRVADAGPSIPHLSTTATVIVHLVPWSTSTVATRTHRATVRGALGPWEVGREDLEGRGDPVFQTDRWGKTLQREPLSVKSLAIQKSNSGVWGGPTLGGV